MGRDERAAPAQLAVLVVDDDRDNLRLLAGILGEQGCVVRLAPSGRFALESARAAPPDLILLDIGLPDLTGYTVCELLKADPDTAGVPVIFLSARQATFDIVRAFAAGAVDFITKPFAAEEVLARVHAHLSNQQLRRQLQQHVAQLEHEVAARRQTEEALRRRVVELEALNLIAQGLTSGGDVSRGVTVVSPTIRRLFDAASVAVWVCDRGKVTLRLLAGAGASSAPPGPTLTPALSMMALAGPPVRAVDLDPGHPLLGGVRPPEAAPGAHGALLVTLLARGEPVGLLCIGASRRDQVYQPADLALAQTVGGVLASAVENTRLIAEAQHAAAERERRRLARELHDSVSQALYAANRAAEAIPVIWELDPEEGRERLEDLQRFTGGALAEMRTLLVELRPRALVDAPLHTTLSLLAEALVAKGGPAVRADLRPVPLLPPDVQVTLYRIAQEALANVGRHARATAVSLKLSATPPPLAGQPWGGSVTLSVEDDGRGFTPGQVEPGRMGLVSIRERAAECGAELAIVSRPGAGTRISVIWSSSGPAGPSAAAAPIVAERGHVSEKSVQ